MTFLTSFFKRDRPSEENILNTGLAMAMEFGSNWLKPIDDRLSRKYKFLSVSELQQYNKDCQHAMGEGHSYIYKKLEKLTDSNCKISDNDLKQEFNLHMKNNFSWISDDNLRNLYSQSCYYAWKDGLDNAIIS